VTWVIKQTDKGKFKISASSWKSLDDVNSSGQKIPYDQAPQTEQTQPVNQTTTQVTTTAVSGVSQSGVSVGTGTSSVNMNISISEQPENQAIGIDFVVPNGEVVQSSNQSTQTIISTNTTTTSSTTTNTTNVQETVQPKTNHLPDYNGRVGCENPVTSGRFDDIIESIASKDFEDSRLTVAKQAISSNCMFVSQVKEIINLFDFERSKLEFAKAAYNSTYDIDNYYQVNEEFDFESSVEELNSYISR
jgi:hypothetical protein